MNNKIDLEHARRYISFGLYALDLFIKSPEKDQKSREAKEVIEAIIPAFLTGYMDIGGTSDELDFMKVQFEVLMNKIEKERGAK